MAFHVHVDFVSFVTTGAYALLFLFFWRQLAAAIGRRWPALGAGMAAVAS